MKSTRRWLIMPLLFLTTSLLAADHLYPLITVEDGDTLVVLIDKQATRIQLIGIDAPEDIPNPKYAKDMERTQLDPNRLLAIGKAASHQLVTLLGENGRVRFDGDLGLKDKYGRLPARVLTEDGKSINKQMVGSGFAIAMKRGKTNSALKKILIEFEAEALLQKKGLWKIDSEAMEKWSGLKASR